MSERTLSSLLIHRKNNLVHNWWKKL